MRLACSYCLRAQPRISELNAFFIDGEKTRRFWTGTTWSFDVDNRGGAIAGISATIGAEVAKVRDELRSYERPLSCSTKVFSNRETQL